MKTFGELVRDERKRRGLSLRQVADMCGIAHDALQKIEVGATKSPIFYNAIRICAALDISMDLAIRATLYEHLPPRLAGVPAPVRERLQAMAKPVDVWIES